MKNFPNILREDPVANEVYKLEQQGFTLETLISKIDTYGDRVLTIPEIKVALLDLL